jgi:hypothetical protein
MATMGAIRICKKHRPHTPMPAAMNSALMRLTVEMPKTMDAFPPGRQTIHSFLRSAAFIRTGNKNVI